MNDNAQKFLLSILGIDGANALIKAAERSDSLSTALLPRSIMAWISFASRWGYEGEIPGVPGSFLQFSKSGPDIFTGFIEVDSPSGHQAYEFENATLTHLAAATAVALNADSGVDPALKESDLVKLGKNLDIIVMSRFLNLIKKQNEETPGESHSSEETSSPEGSISKEELPGQAAPPRAPKAPEMAVPQKKQPKLKAPSLKITKAQSERACVVCDEPQFKNNKFQGCFCVRDLATFTKSESDGKGNYLVHFGQEWNENDISVLIDMIEG